MSGPTELFKQQMRAKALISRAYDGSAKAYFVVWYEGGNYNFVSFDQWLAQKGRAPIFGIWDGAELHIEDEYLREKTIRFRSRPFSEADYTAATTYESDFGPMIAPVAGEISWTEQQDPTSWTTTEYGGESEVVKGYKFEGGRVFEQPEPAGFFPAKIGRIDKIGRF
jgi:hypothetical protein